MHKRPSMRAQFLAVIASALALASNIAGAQAPSPMMQGQGMMGEEMMGRGMGMMGHSMMGRGPGLRIMMILMDADGDGSLSLDEVQATHAKIFKAIDANKDGEVTLEEIQAFFGGSSSPSGH